MKKILALLLATAAAAGSLAGCSSSQPAASSSAASSAASSEASSAASGDASSAASSEAKEDLPPVQMEWLVGQTSAEVDDNAEVVKMIEERFNIDLKAWAVDSKNFQSALNVRFAGGEMPDALVVDLANLPSYVDGGVLHEVPVEDIRAKAPNYTKVADEYDDGTLWSTMVYKGKNYGVVQPMEQAPMATIWNKTWLDNLGLEPPETIEEFEQVLSAFVNDDPDGNGQKDTAGMAERSFGGIFGAYGLRCVTGGSPHFKVEEMQLGEDNVPFFPWIHPDAKEVLALLNKWYNMGIVDKEFVTGENHGGYTWLSHSFMNGRIGLTAAQPYHYLNYSTDTTDEDNWGVCMKEFKGLNPDSDILFGPAPVGPNGKSGTEGWNKTGRLMGLTTKCYEDERKVDAFFAMMDAYYSDMDYARLVNYGIEGVHWKQSPGGPVRIMEGVELREQGVLQVDFGSTVTFAQNITPEKTSFGHSVTGNGYWRFNAPPTEEFSNSIATLQTLTEQAYFDMISGAKPLDYFEQFVEEFKAAGGEAAEKAVQEAYAAKQVK